MTKFFLLFSLVVQAFLWLFVHSMTVEKSLDLSKTELKLSELRETSSELEKEIALGSSLAVLKERAQKLGLVEIDKIVLIESEVMVAYQP